MCLHLAEGSDGICTACLDILGALYEKSGLYKSNKPLISMICAREGTLHLLGEIRDWYSCTSQFNEMVGAWFCEVMYLPTYLNETNDQT